MGFVHTHPEFVKLGLHSWHTLPVPPMMLLVRFLKASSLYSTRVLLACTTCAANDAVCAISARLEPSLYPCTPGAYYVCHQRCSWRNLQTARVFTRPVCSWRALPGPPMMQLVQSPHASSLNPTRVLLARTTCAADDATCAISECLEPLLKPCAPGAPYLCR